MDLSDCMRMITAQHNIICVKNKVIGNLQNKIILLEKNKKNKKKIVVPKLQPQKQ